MNAEQAIRLVESRRAEFGVRPDMEPVPPERAIVRYKADRRTPGPSQDRVAWIVIYTGSGGFIRIDVDDTDCRVLFHEVNT